MTERVSDWTLGDAIERLEASGPDSTFLVGPMDKPLVLTTFRELEERRKLDAAKQAVLSRDGASARVSSAWLTVEILRANCEGKTWHEHSRNVWLAMVELDQHRVDAVRRAEQRCETCDEGFHGRQEPQTIGCTQNGGWWEPCAVCSRWKPREEPQPCQ